MSVAVEIADRDPGRRCRGGSIESQCDAELGFAGVRARGESDACRSDDEAAFPRKPRSMNDIQQSHGHLLSRSGGRR
jgi:hypothetical protein